MRWYLAGLLVVSPLQGYVPSSPIEDLSLREAFEEHRFEEAERHCDQCLSLGKGERGELLLHKAIALLLQEKPEAAYRTFLSALNTVLPGKAPTLSQEEKEHYEEALTLYLKAQAQDRRQVSLEIRERWGPILAMNPDYYQLGFLVACAHANVGMMDDFFTLFYRSYSQYPDHYLAQKTLGHLHLQLMQISSSKERGETLRDQVLTHLERAADMEPRDTSLQKMLVVLSRGEAKRQYLLRYLDRVLADDRLVSRSDLFLYVKEAADAGLFDLAQRLLEKGQSWYEYSRSLNAAADYLKEKRDPPPR